MKHKIKKQKHLLPLCLLLLGATFQSHAQRADYMYLYSSGGEQSFSLDEIQKITFTEQNMQVHLSSGSLTSISYDHIARLTFTPQAGSSMDVPVKEEVKIYYNPAGDRVVIESPLLITSVNLYNIQGVLLQQSAPQSLSVNMSLSTRPAGVYIVQVSNAQGVSVRKVIKN